MNRNTHTQHERDPMRGKKKRTKNIYTHTNNNPPAMEDGWEQLLPRVADWGWFGCQGVFLALFCCCPSTWVMPIVKGSRSDLGKGVEGGQLGLVALLGRCQKTKTKHVFILSAPAWAQASAGEREGEGGARQQKAAVLRRGPAATSLRSRPSSRSRSLVPLSLPTRLRLPSPSWHGSPGCAEQSRHPSPSRR